MLNIQEDKEVLPFKCTCPQLVEALGMIHCGNPAYVDELIDIWLISAPDPSPKTKALVGVLKYDPRTDNITERWVRIKPLAKWIAHIAYLRGEPYSVNQIHDMLNGKPNYGPSNGGN